MQGEGTRKRRKREGYTSKVGRWVVRRRWVKREKQRTRKLKICRRGHKNYQRKALKEEDKGKEKKLCMNKINTKKGKKEKEKKTKKVE